MSEVEQRGIVEAEERALEHDGERQIVVRHEQHLRERDEILDRELIHEAHAVGARHRHALPLERADHGRGEGIAPPHQDQNVPGR